MSNQILERLRRIEKESTSVDWSRDDLPRFAPVRSSSIWSDLYLMDMESLQQSVDKIFANRLARASERYAIQNKSTGFCLRGVRSALNNVYQRTGSRSKFSSLNFLPRDDLPELPADQNSQVKYPGKSAETFRRWAESNPLSLCQVLGLADATKFTWALFQKGAIHVFRNGSCGFHDTHGHIEIVVDPTRKVVCSDHCRKSWRPCAPDLILVPVKSCDWLTLNFDRITLENISFGHLSFQQPYTYPSWKHSNQELKSK
ncbi:MAG: hypothetical protein OXT67_12920 [Zetaproteobacteria bacterium]|nr:hypothetical protein [Zetaproteobacteria bacterium]